MAALLLRVKTVCLHLNLAYDLCRCVVVFSGLVLRIIRLCWDYEWLVISVEIIRNWNFPINNDPIHTFHYFFKNDLNDWDLI